MNKKQVMDIRSSAGITVAESDEHQRNWDDRMWDRKVNSDGANYDRTRSHLNFEIAKGCVVQPIDTSKSITQRFDESLASRGIRDPNEGREDKNRRTLANIIFQGSREQMHKLAFGDQTVDLSPGADNSNIKRCKDIEEWAKDMYRFVADKFGEDNIVGFYVHCDEVNPHVHCSLIPVTPRNRISWKYWFVGKDKYEAQKKWADMHTELAKINKKWGLERGENIHETGALHRTTEEYRREAAGLETEIHGLEKQKESKKMELSELYEEMNKAKRKIKSFETMIENLSKKKDDIEKEINTLKTRLGASPDTPDEEIVLRLKELSSMYSEVSAALEKRKIALADAKKELENLRTEKDMLLALRNRLKQENVKIMDDMEVDARSKLSNASISILGDGIGKLLPTLSPPQLNLLFGDKDDVLDSSQLQTLAEKAEEVMSCAVLLYFGFVDKATTYVESHGGGGPGTGWRKKDDEDDILWARRCVRTATRMFRPSRSRRR